MDIGHSDLSDEMGSVPNARFDVSEQESLDNDMQAFRAKLSKSKRIVVLAGAGLSAASGIPTFRGNGGHWRKHDVLTLATPAAFIGNPSRCWQFHHYLREIMFKSTPNAAHMALARFALPQLRHTLSPGSSFTLITQNIDGLDRRAIEQIYKEHGVPSPFSGVAQGQPSGDAVLIEMHGQIAAVLCTNYECRHRELNYDSPICPGLAGTELLVEGVSEGGKKTEQEQQNTGPKRNAAEARAWAEARLAGLKQQNESSPADPDIPLENLPRCKKCGALTRPDVVWFTEVPQRIDEVMRAVENADLCMVVGTSAVVHPAATFSTKVKENGGTVAVFNIERSKRDAVADYVFLGPCEDLLPRALAVEDPTNKM
ncbi:DHS-like NAD/FAD-binding domain-containing protein [Cubamyces sp. BRFM 1775]|nr:DHS-like NAD/FAD-binding domain-containing protein [Cubamyces sp. BRFM 1775]